MILQMQDLTMQTFHFDFSLNTRETDKKRKTSMATKKKAVAKKIVAKAMAKVPANGAKKPAKAAAKAKKAPMVPTVDTFTKVGNGKLKAVAPKAKSTAKKTLFVVAKTAAKKSVAKKIATKAKAKKPVVNKAKAKAKAKKAK